MNTELRQAWEDAQGKLLFPKKSGHPYYISAPWYLYSSAGVRALYLLCDALNRMGFEAYITNHPFGKYQQFHPWTCDELAAPMLTEHRAKSHYKEGLTPILLYPEIISGNPLRAPVVARWVLNFPGLLGGDTTYDPSEICFGYCRELAKTCHAPDQILHVPTIDTRIFYPNVDPGVVRHGGCFFASKYQNVHNGELLPVTDGCFEITRQLPDSLAPKEVADLLRRSEVFYAYENTALATEAVLCGCPAVFIPNPYLTTVIAQEELGTDGYAWGTDPEEIERAKATVAQGAINYLKTYDMFWKQLNQFISITQDRAARTPYSEMIYIPSWPPTPSVQPRRGFRKYMHFIEKKGVRPLVHQAKSLLSRRDKIS
jgi:hypothetical protein